MLQGFAEIKKFTTHSNTGELLPDFAVFFFFSHQQTIGAIFSKVSFHFLSEFAVNNAQVGGV